MSRIRTNIITNRMANGAPTVSNGLVISGITTTSEIFVGSTIKLDPVSGIVTATTADINGDLDVDGHTNLDNVSIAGVVTATTFVGAHSGNGANLTNLPAAQLTGTIADARISSSSVTQHVTAFDDNNIVNDISILALKVSALENSASSNTNSTFVDTFQDSAGISTITNSSRDTTGEYITTIIDTWGTETLWQTTDLDINSFQVYATPGTSAFGSVGTNMINGSNSAGAYGFYLPSPNAYTRGFGYKFGADSDFGVKTRITEIHLTNNRTNARFQDYKVQTSNDGTNWTDQEITASGNASQQTTTVVRMANVDNDSNAVLNSYFQGTATASAVRVMFNGWYNAGNDNAGIGEFKMKAFKYTGAVYATGSFQSVTINAAATTSKMGVVITYVNASGTATLNTDLKVYLSADNGSNYTQVTLVAQPDFATGIKSAKANDVTISNTGTQLKYKVEFANQSEGSKVTRVTGVSVQY